MQTMNLLEQATRPKHATNRIEKRPVAVFGALTSQTQPPQSRRKEVLGSNNGGASRMRGIRAIASLTAIAAFTIVLAGCQPGVEKMAAAFESVQLAETRGNLISRLGNPTSQHRYEVLGFAFEELVWNYNASGSLTVILVRGHVISKSSVTNQP